ncbi:MAG: superoxide dismutase [Actinomycetota bacterium]
MDVRDGTLRRAARGRPWRAFPALVLTAALVVPQASAQTARPRRIDLPRGFQPEGIATEGTTFYVGSIPSGRVYRGDLLTGEGAVLVRRRRNRAAIGLKVEGNRLLVAGGSTGRAFVYDAATGDPVRAFRLARRNTFVNDVIVAGDVAWFTDSLKARLYRIRLRGGGGFGRPRARRLRGAFRLREGFNVNGIEAARGGERLIIVQSNTGRLFRVNPGNMRARRIRLRGGRRVRGGDGLLLQDANRLWVVRGGADNALTLVRLRYSLRRGRIVRRVRRPSFDVPTTVAESGDFLAVVNARFGVSRPRQRRYWVSQLRP